MVALRRVGPQTQHLYCSPTPTIEIYRDPDLTEKMHLDAWSFPFWYLSDMPASVARLDARPTGDQEVTGSTPAEVGNILAWRLIMKYFLRSFSPFRWFKKGSCQFLAKEYAQYWLTA